MLRGWDSAGVLMNDPADPGPPANTNRTYMTDRTYMLPVSAMRDKRHESGPHPSDT
jgi:hypothetical protein